MVLINFRLIKCVYHDKNIVTNGKMHGNDDTNSKALSLSVDLYTVNTVDYDKIPFDTFTMVI